MRTVYQIKDTDKRLKKIEIISSKVEPTFKSVSSPHNLMYIDLWHNCFPNTV